MIYNTIHHEIRNRAKLSLLDYCLLESIYKMSTAPTAVVAGWCSASRSYFEYLATGRTLTTRFKHLQENGWLEFYDDKKLIKRTTTKYYQEIVAYIMGEKTLEETSTPPRRNFHPPLEETSTSNNISNNNNNIDIKEENFLSSLEAKKLLDNWLADDNNLRVLEMVVRKKFGSLQEARQFYQQIAEEFCETGFSRYKSYRRFKVIADILPKFQSWCRNAKYVKPKLKHRLADEYTEEEFLAAKEWYLKQPKAAKSEFFRKEIEGLKMKAVLSVCGKLLKKVAGSPEFNHMEGILFEDLIKVYIQFRSRPQRLREIFSDISYAPKLKTVIQFIDNRQKYIK